MAKKKYLSAISLETSEAFKTLGANLREARESRRWSIAAASERALMSPNTLQAVEAGKLEVSSGAIAALLDLYGLGSQIADVAAPHKDEEGRRLRSIKGR